MKLIKITPKKSLTYLLAKKKLDKNDIELFKHNLNVLLSKIDEIEREENQKIHIRDFLRDTFYKGKYEINTKDTKDLVIHTGKTNRESVAIIIEAKRPSNKSEMLSFKKTNTKAFQELVLYYLDERVNCNNIDIKYLIATNVYEWYIIEASYFEKHFYRNRSFLRAYQEWRLGQKVTKDTNLFYNQIAKPHIDKVNEEIPCVHFDIREYQSVLNNKQGEYDKNLIPLQKLLSPFFLLKEEIVDDSNSLNEQFYNELLHIIGLEEVQERTRKILRRKSVQQSGSLIENTINILETEDCLLKIKDKLVFGKTKPEQLFNLALELSLIWINRILFLKLLEGLLITYHNNNKDYLFLNSTFIPDYDELYKLFHQVVSREIENRSSTIRNKYALVPYLNSSLFEISELENLTIRINSLDNSETIELFEKTILHKEKRKKKLSLLDYLFRFLNAYDFSNDDGQEIVEEKKTIITASVLGKVFEKISGYKDGAVYTPGYITMFMCKEAIRLGVLKLFNTHFRISKLPEVDNFTDLYNKIDKIGIPKSNAIINSILICDPAVGSGHFLVSALNEIISIKSELGILVDARGKSLRGYEIIVDNDELVIRDENGIFKYNFKNIESQRVQETIFKERQTIIENCLFGVDLNPNSVKICQLRLWIELLKSSYYKSPDFTQLETLPNIDINIKCGNSLISRYPLDADIKNALGKGKSIKNYKDAIATYHETRSKEKRHAMQEFIKEIKQNYITEINRKDPTYKSLNSLKKQHINLTDNPLFDFESDKASKAKKLIESLKKKIKDKEDQIEQIKSNVIYNNAFEWRFEFPEVLDEQGNFRGFDIIIGNPPYGVSIKNDVRKHVTKAFGKVPDFEIYYYFINLAKMLLNENGIKSYIIPNSLLFNVYASNYRKNIFDSWHINEILDCTSFNIFEGSATVRCIITQFSNRKSDNTKVGYRPTASITTFDDLISRDTSYTSKDKLLECNKNWALVFKLDTATQNIISKISKNPTLDTYFDVSQGYIPYRKSDLIKLYGEDEAEKIVKNRLWHSNNKLTDEYKQEIWGENLSKYSYIKPDSYIRYGKHLACYVDLKYFNQNRLLIREITNPRIIGCLVSEELVNDPQIISVIPKSKTRDIKFLWAIMNSNIATFYHFNSSPKATKGVFPKILVQDIKKFPIPNISDKQHKDIINMVSTILSKHQKGIDVNSDELLLNIKIAEVYNLTRIEEDLIEKFFNPNLNMDDKKEYA